MLGELTLEVKPALPLLAQRPVEFLEETRRNTSMPPGLLAPAGGGGMSLAGGSTHRTTSTAPGRTLGSLPMMDTLAAKDPSMLNTTHSMPRGSTVR